jgi:hypothetical protein
MLGVEHLARIPLSFKGQCVVYTVPRMGLLWGATRLRVETFQLQWPKLCRLADPGQGLFPGCAGGNESGHWHTGLGPRPSVESVELFGTLTQEAACTNTWPLSL